MNGLTVAKLHRPKKMRAPNFGRSHDDLTDKYRSKGAKMGTGNEVVKFLGRKKSALGPASCEGGSKTEARNK